MTKGAKKLNKKGKEMKKAKEAQPQESPRSRRLSPRPDSDFETATITSQAKKLTKKNALAAPAAP